jgi:hypothetical protein
VSPTDHDREIRALLDDAVAGVEPGYGLDAIRSRTVVARRRPWVLAAGAAVLATAATIAAVMVLGDPGATNRPAGPADGASQRPAGPAVGVYFVGDSGAGLRLFREVHAVPAAGSSVDGAVEKAVTGAARDTDYRSPWPAGTTFERAQLSGGVLSVDLSGPVADRPAGMSEADAQVALQQLVYTAQSAVQRTLPVTFLLDGRPADTVLGISTRQPVPRRSADDVLAQVSVSSPADGATVSSPFTVEGEAAAFEANVQWELMRGDTVVRQGFTTAAECCTLSPYEFTVQAPPGDYTLVVHDEDVSEGEGGAPPQDTKRVTVR